MHTQMHKAFQLYTTGKKTNKNRNRSATIEPNLMAL